MKIKSERSRIRAALVNSGKWSIDEADERLAASSLTIYLADDVATSPAGQAAFLTAVVTGARCFGSVSVEGALDCPVIVPLPLGAKTLRKAAATLGAQPASGAPATRTIIIGQSWPMDDRFGQVLDCAVCARGRTRFHHRRHRPDPKDRRIGDLLTIDWAASDFQ